MGDGVGFFLGSVGGRFLFCPPSADLRYCVFDWAVT